LFHLGISRVGFFFNCAKITVYKLLTGHASVDRRIGARAIPSDPKSYLNDRQQLGLILLRAYGWNTFCVRRHPGEPATTILRNKHNKRLGILNANGLLRLTENLKIRDRRSEESCDIKDIVDSINLRINKPERE
jgi:hypothetical protein